MSEDQKDLGANAAAVDGAGQEVSDAAPHVAPTPGPWTVETQWAHDVDDNAFPFAHWIAGAEGEQIAEQVLEKPDARLIAAAPDMYEALKAAINGPFSCPSVMVDQMRAALKKAEGK